VGMSRRAYARYRGCSEKAVRKAIAAGRISVGVDDSLDPVEADKQWAANTDPARCMRRSPAGVEDYLPELRDGPNRLARVAAHVPQFAPWIPWVNWTAPRLFEVLRESEEEQCPVADPADMHMVLRSLLSTYLLETGVVSAAEDKIVDPIL